MNQSNVFFSVDQEAAAKAGGGDFISEGGAYKGIITKALCVQAGTGSQGIELSFEDKTGLKCNFITIYYKKKDGEIIKGGHNAINALMVIMGIQNLTYVNAGDDVLCNELVNKPIGLCLQKVLYTKNDGSEGYKFDLRFPFDPSNNQTVKEKASNSPAKSVSLFDIGYKDKDDRKQAQQAPQQQGQGFNGYQNDPQNYEGF